MKTVHWEIAFLIASNGGADDQCDGNSPHGRILREKWSKRADRAVRCLNKAIKEDLQKKIPNLPIDIPDALESKLGKD